MISDQATMSGAVFAALSQAMPEGAPPLHYESMPARREQLPAASMQTLAGDPRVRSYLDGSYIGRYRFALYVRQSADDSGGRLDAMAAIEAMAEAADGAAYDLPDGYDFHRIEQDSLPRAVSAEDGFDDYQVTFSVQYGASSRPKKG